MSSMTPERPVPTKRELTIASFIAYGWEQREIGAELGISHKTVESLWRSCRIKIRARNSLHAVAILVDEGRIDMAVDKAPPQPMSAS